MKILKIELQNINSLKSDSPIVIDFTADKFLDVGLFVITGSTGAGKTTILDAITIALYNNVPRFNASNVKAGLVDVVSHGASDAFSRVTFENKNEIFEASWSMRLASKTGKILTNPQEIVRLKNLTSNIIIAEKKRELQTEVERITQLNYNQFLRSVMLAQGEFASFLTAKGSDKAKLLEQITGEDIYKKIGEAINQKQYEERKKLDVIKAKINSEDLLSSENRKELKLEENNITKSIKQLNSNFTEVQTILDWYKNHSKLLKDEEEIAVKSNRLEVYITDNESNKEKLLLHQMAEPFVNILTSLEKKEADIKTTSLNIGNLTAELAKLTPCKLTTEEKLRLNNDTLIQKETDYKNWLPKLENISKLDNIISTNKISATNITNKSALLNNTINALQKNIDKNSQLKTVEKNNLTKIETFINQNSHIPQFSNVITNWNTQLTQLAGYKKTAKQDTDFCNIKQHEIKSIDSTIKQVNIDLQNHKNAHSIINDKITKTNKQLKLNDLETLLKQISELESKKASWTILLDLSENYSTQIQSKTELANINTNLITSNTNSKLLLSSILEQITKAETSLTDAQKILDLEKSIFNFKHEREKLQKGKPCNLCGSINHPFVDKYKNFTKSITEQELEQRKNELAKLVSKKNQTKITISNNETRVESNNVRIEELELNAKDILQKVKNLNINSTVKNIAEIKNNLITIDKNILSVNNHVQKAKELQKQLKEYVTKEKQMSVTIEKNNIELTKLIEKQSNFSSELLEKNKIIKLNNSQITLLENELADSLSKYGLKLPKINETKKFIYDIEKRIQEYNTKSKNLTEINNHISELEINITNQNTQLADKQQEYSSQKAELILINEKIVSNTEIRNNILPIEVSTTNKRLFLQKSIDNTKEVQSKLTNEFQELTLAITRNTSQKQLHEKELVTLKNEISELTTQINNKLKSSNFNSVAEVKNAQLNNEQKENLEAINKYIEDKTIELKTLTDKLELEKENHLNKKNFDLSLEEVLIKQTEVESEKEKLQKRIGEITESFAVDNRIRERNKGVLQEIDIQEKQLQKWTDLLTLLGGSKHAFNTYVQRLTLQNLIGFANIHLLKLNNRYSLQMNEKYKAGEELNFNLIDHFQTNQSRYVDTSSGGEKFIISLALALGLSDLASNNVQIDSLFIDEGFGTLDNNTLETVISTLETLQSHGKMIGIISHVENLKERISTQIQVSKKSNGVSVVDIV